MADHQLPEDLGGGFRPKTLMDRPIAPRKQHERIRSEHFRKRASIVKELKQKDRRKPASFQHRCC